MKVKTTLILLGVLAALLILVLFILPKKPAEEAAKGPKLTDLKSEEVERLEIKNGPETVGLRKDEKGEWLLTEPLQARADDFEVNRLAEDLSSLQAERVADESPRNPADYGIPKKEVSLWLKGRKEAVRILLGDENPVDNTLYAQKQGEKRVVLLSSSIKALLDKKLIDYRQKDIFNFETSRAQKIELLSKDTTWQAAKKNEDWFLEKPVLSLADKYKLDTVLNSLSGLRATEFILEQKTDEEMAKLGITKPEVEVRLSLPASGQEVTFFLYKKEDKVYATTSLSKKVIAVESQALADLSKKPEELREKGVDSFNAWDAERLRVKSGGLEVALAKSGEGQWRFELGGKGEANSSLVESFIRQVDGLEAVEFIDRPGPLASYGLDKPRAEVVIRVKDLEGKARDVTVQVGTEDKDKKQTVVRNPRLGYLLRVSSTFLADIPKTAKDWEKPREEKSVEQP